MLFRGFPNDVVWREAVLDLEELGNARYPRCDPWVSVGAERLVRDGARFTSRLGLADSQRVERIRSDLEGGMTYPKLIAIAKPDSSSLILLEGNSRATAYCAAGMAAEVPILFGTSPAMDRWAFC